MRHGIKAGLVALVLSISIAASVTAGPLEDGLVAYQRGDYATALRLWRPLADRGVAEAQFHIGTAYASGAGVPRDFAEAAKWFRKAAEQGYLAAQLLLGVAYTTGRGVPQDYRRGA